MEITITEYAARHNRSPVTVRQKALRGGFKTARRVGRDWLIDEDEPYTDNRLAVPPPPDLWQLTSGRRCDTISDAGAVKIANDSFSVLIPTGAGDGFIGSFLWQLERDGVTLEKLAKLSKTKLNEYLAFSNQFCGISVQTNGAIDSYPTLDQMQ